MEYENPGLWRRIWREYKRGRRFETDEMEKLFQRYVLQANKIHLIHVLGLLIASLSVMFLGLVLIFLVSSSTGKNNSKAERLKSISTLLFVFLSIIMFVILLGAVVFHKKTSETFLLHISYLLTATFMVVEMTLIRTTSNLWATVFFVYITYALLPVRLLEATLSGFSLSIVHIPPFQKEVQLPSFRNISLKEIGMNLLILLAMNLVGILTHSSVDMAKRKAFTEIRQYVRTKITVQKETARQQTLLMSVLPEHLIEEMKTDLARLGGSISQRKIYIKTYKPVSFDKLAKKNRCMRIKLLGDCYYCVCGLPKPNNFHASHCVDMGMDMIYAMQVVRKKYSIDVDIRVGVHTGKLQCGVLGLKKWQFDIWGSDVEIANNMETGGVPGKVHISESTKNHLIAMSDNYETELAHGSTREPSLKDIETYFVTPSHAVRVKINENVSTNGSTNLVTPFNTSSMDKEPTVPLFNPLKRERDIERELIATLYNSINARSFRRLKKTNCKSTVLRFKDKHMENKYNQEPDRMLQSYFFTALVVFLSMIVVQLLVMPRTPTLLLCCGIGLLWFIFVSCLVAWKYTSKKCLLRCLEKVSSKIDRSRNLAQSLALVTVVISYVVILIPMVSEDSYDCRTKPDIEQAEARSLTPINYIYKNPLNETCAAKTLPYPEHTLLYTILVMIMTGAFQILMFRFKFMIMLGLCTAYAILLFTAPYFMKIFVDTEAAIKYFLMIMALTSFLLLMLIQSQQSEIVHRLDFIWKINARSDTENVQQLQKFNTKLIENILPAHVAKHYLDLDRPPDEQYHEECVSTCILFAYITKFSFTDVDGEDSERNVTILHDIISDIDELLNEPLFSSVEKIKSTGAIYMAASGLSLTQEDAASYEHVVAMAHFALTLRRHIHQINSRHDTSFGVKIGISMGSVVAGVIGASMPQYDIWGNTVNVASRMYSTGLENQIQVTENVAVVAEKNGFTIEKRGVVFVKGKGSMVTYFLVDNPTLEEAIQRARYLQRPSSSDGPRNSQASRYSRKNSKNEGDRNSTDNATRGSRSSLKKFIKGAIQSPSESEDSVRVSKSLATSQVFNTLPIKTSSFSSDYANTQTSRNSRTFQPSSSRHNMTDTLSINPMTGMDQEIKVNKSSLNSQSSQIGMAENLEASNNKNDLPKPTVSGIQNAESSLMQNDVDNPTRSSRTSKHREAIQRARYLQRPSSSDGPRNSQASRYSRKNSKNEGDRNSTDNATRGSRSLLKKFIKGAIQSPSESEDSVRGSKSLATSQVFNTLPIKTSPFSSDYANTLTSRNSRTFQPSSSRHNMTDTLSINPKTGMDQEIKVNKSSLKSQSSQIGMAENLEASNNKNYLPKPTVSGIQNAESSLMQNDVDNPTRSSRTSKHRVSFSVGNSKIQNTLSNDRHIQNVPLEMPKRKKMQFWKKRCSNVPDPNNLLENANSPEHKSLQVNNKQDLPEDKSVKRVRFLLGNEEIQISPRDSDNNQSHSNSPRRKRWKFWKRKEKRTTEHGIEQTDSHLGDQGPPSEITEDPQNADTTASPTNSNWVSSFLGGGFWKD